MTRSRNRRCDGIARRDFVRAGSLAALGLTVGGPLSAAASTRARAERAVLIWLDGGPTHLETWDVKPDAPREVRGPFQPISTRVPGVAICEHLPELAERFDQLAVIRSLTSPLGEHNFGTHYMMTGYAPTPALEYPAIGSVVASLRTGDAVLPPHVAVPRFRVGGGKFSGGGFLPPRARPFSVGGDPAKRDFRVQDLDFYPGIDEQRVNRRQRYLSRLDALQRSREGVEAAPDPFFEQAFRLITNPDAKRAFQLDEEPSDVRARYGGRTVGQSCLLARRLLERGVPFVTVNNPGWDTHENAVTRLRDGYDGARQPVGLLPSLDRGCAALIDDLRDRDMLDSTLIIVMGEFGRTPKLNTRGGRDHWPRVFSVMLAGAGLSGQVIGASDSVGEGPADRPVTPADLAATIYTLLGIDPDTLLHTPDGRPIRVGGKGTAVGELV